MHLITRHVHIPLPTVMVYIIYDYFHSSHLFQKVISYHWKIYKNIILCENFTKIRITVLSINRNFHKEIANLIFLWKMTKSGKCRWSWKSRLCECIWGTSIYKKKHAVCFTKIICINDQFFFLNELLFVIVRLLRWIVK